MRRAQPHFCETAAQKALPNSTVSKHQTASTCVLELPLPQTVLQCLTNFVITYFIWIRKWQNVGSNDDGAWHAGVQGGGKSIVFHALIKIAGQHSQPAITVYHPSLQHHSKHPKELPPRSDTAACQQHRAEEEKRQRTDQWAHVTTCSPLMPCSTISHYNATITQCPPRHPRSDKRDVLKHAPNQAETGISFHTLNN